MIQNQPPRIAAPLHTIRTSAAPDDETRPVPPPISNYTLSSICPSCDAPTIRRACKVRCERCGFMWDCSEL